MPITFEYDSENNILYETATGPLSLEDFIQHRQNLSEIQLKSGLKCLSNFEKASIDMHYEEIHFLSNSTLDTMQSIHLENITIAIIAQDDLGFGLARMYEAITSNDQHSIKVFRTLDEAKSWLGINM